MMKSERPEKEGHVSIAATEMTDADGNVISRVNVEWFGGKEPQDRLAHNMMQISLGKAVTQAVEQWAKLQAKTSGVDISALG